MPFIETLLCVSHCRYIIMNPYPDLRGHTLDYYPYFTEGDIESGAFAQDGVRFQGQEESLAPASRPHCDPTLPSGISSCALLLSWPSPVLQPEAVLLVYYRLLSLHRGFFCLSSRFLSLATSWICGLEEVISFSGLKFPQL